MAWCVASRSRIAKLNRAATKTQIAAIGAVVAFTRVSHINRDVFLVGLCSVSERACPSDLGRTKNREKNK